MPIVRQVFMLLFSILLFLLLWNLYTPHQGTWRSAPEWGNATPEVRTAVLNQLERFQEGYTKRDVKQLDAYMQAVFSRERPILLGTMPGELYVGYPQVTQLIREDWKSWGDCRFRFDQTQISAVGNVAWFATVGSVKFDLSRYLVLPLRLTGVMANENGVWKIRQAQFQFDLDLSNLLLAQALTAAWMAVSALLLAVSVYRKLVGHDSAQHATVAAST